MKQFRQFLLEGRSHPELNPKINIIDQLSKYKDDPNIFITFTSIEKVGVNPKYDFTCNPIGVYSYPIKEAWKFYRIDSKGINGFPFGNDRPYIFVFKSKDKLKVLNVVTYSEKDFKKDISTIKKWNSDSEYIKFIDLTIEEMEELTQKTPAGKIWYITDQLATSPDLRKFLNLSIIKNRPNPAIPWAHIFRRLGYSSIIDFKGTGLIHNFNPVCAVFLTGTDFTLVDKITNFKFVQPDTWNDKKQEYFSDWEGSGTWKYGIFNGGDWLAGEWRDGIWKSGTWHKGRWQKGTWGGGTWKSGTWLNGIWLDGTWRDGDWRDGTWVDGYWFIGKIYSKKFKTSILSLENPKDFYKLEKESSSLEELKAKVTKVDQ